MDMPLKTFWLMSGNVDRILAQKDMRSMTIAVIGQSTQESVVMFRKQLVVEAGTIVKLKSESPLDAERDDVGFSELKRMSNQ